MTREVRFVAWVLAAMLGFRGLDYATGNTYPMGRAYGEEVAMPTYWGAACIATTVLVVVSLVLRKPAWLKNAALLGFAINTMFVIQSAESRMLPVPWPPEDFRLVFDHQGHAVLWFFVASILWWREGVRRRRSQILTERGCCVD